MAKAHKIELSPDVIARVIAGGNALASGPVSDEGRAAALAEVNHRGFANEA